MAYTYKYPRPAVTADCIVIWTTDGVANTMMNVITLARKRKNTSLVTRKVTKLDIMTTKIVTNKDK